MKKTLLSLSLLVASVAVARNVPIVDFPESWVLEASQGRDDGLRESWDLDARMNLSNAAAVTFEIRCQDPSSLEECLLYLRTGDGLSAANLAWRHASVTVAETPNEWHRVALPLTEFERKPTEGPFAGYGAITGLRFAAYRLKPGKLSFEIREMSRLDEMPDQKQPPAIEKRTISNFKRRIFWCHSPWGLGDKGWEESAKILSRFGFTDVIINVAWADEASYHSNILEMAPECVVRGDALEKFIPACHKYGLRCHGWVVSWKCRDVRRHAACYARMKEEGRLQKDASGNINDWLCANDLRNRRQMAGVYAELASRGVDGIHFDYIRFPDQHHCHCEGCGQRLRAKYGQVKDSLYLKCWRELRIESISSFVKDVSRNVRAEYPKIVISAAVFPNVFSSGAKVGQDWPSWIKNGLVDFVCPMSYTQDVSQYRRYVRTVCGEAGISHCCPGIGVSASICPQRGNDAQVLSRELSVLDDEGACGFTLFDLNSRTMKAVEEVLVQTP